MDSKLNYHLVTLRSGAVSLYSEEYGETLHPGIGPQAEAEALYVDQLRLRERMHALAGAEQERRASLGLESNATGWPSNARYPGGPSGGGATDEPGAFVIWDVGLGAAANAAAVLHATREVAGRTQIISFDATLDPLRYALQQREALGYLQDYAAPLAELISEARVTFVHGRQEVDWRLVQGDFPALLQEPAAELWSKPHAILFDPFSPARNPAMWTLPLFERLFALLDPRRPCALATYSRSTLLRVALLLAGFTVGQGSATGRKEETTLAANHPGLIEQPLGAAWLERARRSGSAEPLREPRYEQRPLSAEAWERLARQPQFQNR